MNRSDLRFRRAREGTLSINASVEAKLLTLEGAGHGFKGPDAEKAEQALLDYFDRHLK